MISPARSLEFDDTQPPPGSVAKAVGEGLPAGVVADSSGQPTDTADNPGTPGTANSARVALCRARLAQLHWSASPLKYRLRVLARLRSFIAADADRIADTVTRRTGPVGRFQTLVGEVLPVCDAIYYLQCHAPRLLKDQKAPWRSRMMWQAMQKTVVRREPRGVVLVIAPSNYPLMLPGIQAIQALAAGNAVLVKPAPGCAAPMHRLRQLAIQAGVPEGAFVVLDETTEAASAVIADGVDLAVLTGSADTGRAVMKQLAETLTPSIMELSGCDAAFVCKDADIQLAARAVAFGVAFNDGETCIAPRRVFVDRAIAQKFEVALLDALAQRQTDADPPAAVRQRVKQAVDEATARGARLAIGSADDPACPIVLADATPEMSVMQQDLFTPIVSICPVDDDDHALTLAQQCPYGLGATVFSESKQRAQALAERVDAGCVVINDMLAPTADPALPFGGRGQSGFGVTRGPDGLLAMTTPKAIVTVRGKVRPHFDPVPEGADQLVSAGIQALHGRGNTRLRGLARLPGLIASLIQKRKKQS